MKRLTLAISLAALALPLCAQTTAPATATDTAAQDSPLVRAAKASKKPNGGKSIVITNDTLVKSGGGHMSTANVSASPAYPAALPKTPGPSAIDQAAMKAKAEADAKAKKAASAKELKTKSVAADLYGESIEERVEDPAQQEHMMNQLTTTQPSTTTSSQPQTVKTNPKPPGE